MRVVGIDPGLAACGYGVVEADGSKAEALAYGCWQVAACARAGVGCAEYPPARVKQAVCGYGAADKRQVQRMAKVLLGLERT